MTQYSQGSMNVRPFNHWPASVASGITYDSGIIESQGSNISVWLATSAATVVHVIQYADYTGKVVVQDTQKQLVAGKLTNIVINDGNAFCAFKITITNSGATPAVLSTAAIVQ